MSLITSRLSLTQLCTLERDVNAGTDDGSGNPRPPGWQTLSTVPCRSWSTAGREAVTDSTTLTVIEDARVIVPLDTDVNESDRVASVTDRGRTVQNGPLGIRAALVRRDYIELVLVKVA